jgi:hypothetical protein
MECYDLLGDFDRVLVLDIDLLIMPNCPNLFQLVPQHMIGTIFEDVGSRKADRLSRIHIKPSYVYNKHRFEKLTNIWNVIKRNFEFR